MIQNQENVYVLNHPLILHKLKMIRDKNTEVKLFRELVEEISALMVYEVMRNVELEETEVETPLGLKARAYYIPDSVAVVPILRAGLGMVSGVLKFVPMAKVGHIGVYRDHDTLKPVEYYCKLPEKLEEKLTILLDPMLATGGSAIYAIDLVKKAGAKNIKFVSLLSAPEGIKALHAAHSDVEIYTTFVDEKLNQNGYIVPGLGDAGDRFFGTK
jgi:uracil phosphoribosyltransferase